MSEGPIEAFVFISGTDAEQLEMLTSRLIEGQGVQVVWRPRAIGSAELFLVLEAESLRALQDFVVDGLRAGGRLRTETMVSLLPVPTHIKRGRLRSIHAIVRCLLTKGHDIEALVKTVAAIEGVEGLAVVTGSADMLVEFADDSFEGIKAGILALARLAGIGHTQTTLLADPPAPQRAQAS